MQFFAVNNGLLSFGGSEGNTLFGLLLLLGYVFLTFQNDVL